jgi:hypothetical protein
MFLLGRVNRHLASAACRRQEKARAWDPAAILSPAQLRVFGDKSRFRRICAGRSSGKSYGAAVELIDTCLQNPGALVMFVAPTVTDAREIIWSILHELVDEFSLPAWFDEGKHLLNFANGARLKLAGAKDRKDAQRQFRGRRPLLVWVDEIQFFPSHVRDLIDGGVKPALLRRGQNGRLVVSGTPSEIPVGWWYERQEDPLWSAHTWTCRDNPHLSNVDEFLAEMAASMGGPQAPRFRREFLCEWVFGDLDSGLIFAYDPAVNDFVTVPTGTDVRRFMGVDLGFRKDRCAIVVLETTNGDPGSAYVVDEYVSPARDPKKPYTTSDFARVMQDFIAKWDPLVSVCDEGGLGGAIADQYRAEFGIPLIAAEKHEPEAAAGFVAGDVAAGRLKIRKTSRVAEDMAVVRWDPEQLAKGKLVEAKDPHSDVIPCLRYVWKHVRPYLVTAPPRKLTEEEKIQAENRAELAAAARGLRRGGTNKAFLGRR